MPHAGQCFTGTWMYRSSVHPCAGSSIVIYWYREAVQTQPLLPEGQVIFTGGGGEIGAAGSFLAVFCTVALTSLTPDACILCALCTSDPCILGVVLYSVNLL